MQLWSRRKLEVGDEDELWELRRETGVGRSKRRLHKEFVPRACVSRGKTLPLVGTNTCAPTFRWVRPCVGTVYKDH